MSVPDGTISSKMTLPSAVGAPVALTMPETHAMPPTTAYWISSTEPNTLYCVNCTFVWRIESSTPPSAAIAAATANAYSFAAMTLMPSEAAARSLLRTASRRAPDAAAPQVRDEQADEHEHDEDERAVALRVPERIEVDARERHARRSAGRRTPPVTELLVKISALNISAIASVATARLVPRVRIAGSATTTPTIVVPDDRGDAARLRTATRWPTPAARPSTHRARPARTGTTRVAPRSRRRRRPSTG